MKKHMRRITALLLALLLAAGQTAYASEALGSELVDQAVELAQGLTLVDGSLWSASGSDLRTEHYLEYTPGGAVAPMLFMGDYVASTNTVAAAAAELESEGWRVAGGINGGFFNQDGTVVGMVMTDGVLRSADLLNYALVGITNDGKIFVDESTLVKTVEWQQADGTAYVTNLSGFNAYRDSQGKGLYLYNGDFASKVNSSRPCVYIILRPTEVRGLTINGSLTMEVVSVNDATAPGAVFNGVIPEGCYMLYAESTAPAALLEQLRALPLGRQVTVSIAGGSEQWAQASYGVSAMQVLVRDGKTVAGLETGAAPRTAIGLRSDGSAVFYTIDGRRSGYSIGASYTQVADRLIELGCVTAVAMDGGGSTTLGATLPGSASFAVVNKPSGSLRAVNNAILFLAPGGATGILGGFSVTAERRVVLTGSKLTVSAAGYDTAGYPMAGASPVWSAAGGSIEGSGGSTAVYTAGNAPGTYQITAASGGREGQYPVRVIDSLTTLTAVRKEDGSTVASLNLAPGDKVELSTVGQWYKLPVAMDAAAEWTTEGGVGEITADGVFTAGKDNAMGSITAAIGGKTVTIPVRVDRGDPFVDMGRHWGAKYVTELYKLGVTNGSQRADGSYVFLPDAELTRGELLVFLTRLLKIDTSQYEQVKLPFADADSIAGWKLPAVKTMYALQVLEGTTRGGQRYAAVDDKVTRETAMTILGRVLANAESYDLSVFSDGATVSSWASAHVQTLVAKGVVEGSGGKLTPKRNITRGEVAKLLVLINGLEKKPLEPRPDLTYVQPEQS